MAWGWTARRLFISAFLLLHLGATLVWVIPPCPIKQRCFSTAAYYMLPLGIWQYWGMFAPDPAMTTLFLEAEAIDAQGLRHLFVFPRVADYSKWGAIPRFRHSKFAANLLIDEFIETRKFVARHVLRKLDLPATAYPVDVHLYYKFVPLPPPGALADPMTPSGTHTIATFAFQSHSEVLP